MGGRGGSSGIGANASGARDEAYYQAKVDDMSKKYGNIRKYKEIFRRRKERFFLPSRQ